MGVVDESSEPSYRKSVIESEGDDVANICRGAHAYTALRGRDLLEKRQCQW